LEEGKAGAHAFEAADGVIAGAHGLAAVSGGLPNLVDAGLTGGVMDPLVRLVPDGGLQEAAAVGDECRELVLSVVYGEGKAHAAEVCGDAECDAESGEVGAHAVEGLAVEAAVLAVGRVVLRDGANGR